MSAPPGAVESAQRGWAVGPAKHRDKTPRPGHSWPAIACSDPERVALARWRPGENYLIACKKSGLVVLDLDTPKPGYEFPAEWQAEPGVVDGADVLAVLCERAGQPWPLTFWVRTPRGGSQLYFAALQGRPIGNRPLGPLIDVRGGGEGDGGYVIGPGSIVDERAYKEPEIKAQVRGGRPYVIVHDQEPEPLPDWIADLLDPPMIPPAPGETRRLMQHPATFGGQPRNRLRGVVEHVLNGSPGDRNGRLHWAACKAGEMIALGQLDRGTAEQVLLEAALEAGLAGGEREARATIASGLRRGAA